MTRRLTIASTSNERLKAVRKLARKRARDVVLAEGHRALRCALDADARVREVYAAPELFLGEEDALLVSRAESAGARVVEVGTAAFRSAASNVRPDGLLAIVERPGTALASLRPTRTSLLVVAAGIERPGNLGTIARTACAAGAAALIVSDERTDVFHPEVVRGSVGTIFRLPVAAAPRERAIAWLQEHDVRLLAATPGGTHPHWDADYRGAVAVVVGNERYGLGDEWLSAADETVSIPMCGPADSLNVAVATGVLLFEALRRRA